MLLTLKINILRRARLDRANVKRARLNVLAERINLVQRSAKLVESELVRILGKHNLAVPQR
jgi:hypothetical protein